MQAGSQDMNGNSSYLNPPSPADSYKLMNWKSLGLILCALSRGFSPWPSRRFNVFAPAALPARPAAPRLARSLGHASHRPSARATGPALSPYVRSDAVPATYIVRVSADNRFILYVNGKRVGDGPARGDLTHWRYERFDLAPPPARPQPDYCDRLELRCLRAHCPDERPHRVSARERGYRRGRHQHARWLGGRRRAGPTAARPLNRDHQNLLRLRPRRRN